MTTVLLDSHVLHWWSAEPDKLSEPATATISAASELAVSDITWLELAWLAHHERITLAVPLRAWLKSLADQVMTVGITPEIAAMSVELPSNFPRDRADRLIVATALQRGWPLATKDERIRTHPATRKISVW